MTLSVLTVAYPLAAVGPDAVGGVEQVAGWLDAALIRAGHRSVVIAAAGSTVAGTLVATPPPGDTLDDARRHRARQHHAAAIAGALDRWRFDLVHMHGIDFHAYLPPPGVPVLATLHLPPSWYPPETFRPTRPGTWLHCVSASQHGACPPSPALLPPIPNGVPVELFAGRHARRRFALALGRICPEKGFHLAIEAARQAGLPLLLGGQVFGYETHRRYFRDEIVQRLDGWRRFLGPVGLARKRRLLAAARCLVVPSLAPETSSLVAMEALAAGTPVIAMANGALPEIVDHGRTGFLVEDVSGMAAAIEAAPAIDPAACRDAARARFSVDGMAGRYLELYHRLSVGCSDC